MGSVSQLLAKHSVQVRSGRIDIHRDQGIVERFNRTLAERLFEHQYAQEMRRPSGERSTEWVKRLPSVVAALNGEGTRLTGKKPSDAIKAKTLTQKPSSVVPGRPLGLKEQNVPSGVGVRYLYQPGELEGGRRRATVPVWSLEVYRLGRSVTKPDEPVLYYLQGDDAPQRGFVREELLAVPSDTQLPPDAVLMRLTTLQSTPRHPARTASLCSYASVSTPFFAIQRWESKGERDTLFRCCRKFYGALTARHPCHGGMFAFRRVPLCTASA